MSRRPLQVAWPDDPGWKPFGHRLNFLSPERQHLALHGRMSILPPRNPEKRKPYQQEA